MKRIQIYKDEELLIDIGPENIAVKEGYTAVIDEKKYPPERRCPFCGNEVIKDRCTVCGVLLE